MSALAVGRSTLNDLLMAQSAEVPNPSPFTPSSQVSDRERAGLRGPVRTVSGGSTKTEYDLAGRLISQRWLPNPDSEASETIRTLTYDGSGRLLTETVRTGSGILSDKVYSYDDKRMAATAGMARVGSSLQVSVRQFWQPDRANSDSFRGMGAH